MLDTTELEALSNRAVVCNAELKAIDDELEALLTRWQRGTPEERSAALKILDAKRQQTDVDIADLQENRLVLANRIIGA